MGNLVANAVAYGAADSEVTVSSSFEDQTVVITVHNLGTPPYHRSIFSNERNDIHCNLSSHFKLDWIDVH
ncbi:hypothetical protein ACFS4T_15170 [Pseudomonas lini]